MSDVFWKKLNLFATWGLIAVIFSFLAFLLGIEIKDFDLWLHLAVGKYIVTTGVVPDVDILSFTRAGAPWSNHEWLFQVMAYLSYAAAAAQGLVTMQTVIVMMTVGMLLLMGYNKERPLTAVLTLLLVILVYKTRLTHRPDLASLLFFTSYVYILSTFLCRRWALMALFVIQVLWTNMHGFFIFGPLMMALGVFAEYVRRYIPLPFEWNVTGKLTNEEFKRMHIGLLVVSAACFVNPSFIEGVLYPLKIMFSLSGDNDIFFKHIRELQNPITRDNIFSLHPFFHYRLMIILSAFSFVINYRKIDISALFMWLVFLIFSINASRNIVFFAVMGYFAVLINLQYVMTKKLDVPISQKTVSKLSILCKIVVGAWVVKMMFALALNGYFDFQTMERKPEFDGQFSKLEHPFEAVDFLAENKIKGNFFNDFNSGAYLIGRMYPDIRVFIDGRTELYGAEFFDDYHHAWRGDKERIAEFLDTYPVTGAFLNSSSNSLSKPLIRFFYDSPEWVMIYFNHDAIIFLKDIPFNQQWIEELVVNIKEWKPPAIDLHKVGFSRISAHHYFARAQHLYDMGLSDIAKEEVKLGLELNPIETGFYQILGEMHYDDGEYDDAFVKLRQAKILGGRTTWVNFDLGRVFLKLGKIDKAKKQCDWGRKKTDGGQRFILLCAEIDVYEEKYDEAMKAFKGIDELRNYYVEDVVSLADALYEKEQFEMASEVYQKSAKLDPRHTDVEDWKKKIKDE